MTRAALVFLLCLGFPIFAFGKPYLDVWTSIVGPDGKSRCGPCNKFWGDLEQDASFKATLTNAYVIRPIYSENHPVEASLRGIRSLPTFEANGGRINGYTSSDDLLARLHLKRLSPQQVPAPEVRPSQATGVYLSAEQLDQALAVLNTRLRDIEESVNENTKHINQVGVYIEDDQPRQRRIDEHYKSLTLQMGDVNLRLRGFSEQLGRIATVQSGSQAGPLAEAPEPESPKPSITERVLELGRYPATWFLGPLGGAGVTGLLWFVRSRKKKEPGITVPEGEADSRANDIEARLRAGLKEMESHLAQLIKQNDSPLAKEIEAKLRELEARVNKPPIVETIPIRTDSPPQIKIEKETRYHPVQNRLDAEAYEYAFDALVDKHPESQGNIAFIKSVADQFRSAKLHTSK